MERAINILPIESACSSLYNFGDNLLFRILENKKMCTIRNNEELNKKINPALDCQGVMYRYGKTGPSSLIPPNQTRVRIKFATIRDMYMNLYRMMYFIFPQEIGLSLQYDFMKIRWLLSCEKSGY